MTTYINKSNACIYAKGRLLNDAELIAWLSGLNMYVSLAAVGRHPLFLFELLTYLVRYEKQKQ